MQDKKAIIFADGGSRGNPGPAGSGAIIKLETAEGQVLAELSKFLGTTTNNVAEYTGLIIGLEKARELGFRKVEVRMDSELVVKQMKGIYSVKNAGLQPLFRKACTLSEQFDWFDITHVRREHNKEADKLANQAMDAKV